MRKLVTFVTTSIVLIACGNDSIREVVPKDQQLPLTYHFDVKEVRDGIGFKGEIIFDVGCFYSDFYESRMAIVFPHTFRWNKSSELIEASLKTIKSGQKIVVGGAVIVDRNTFAQNKVYLISNETCLTEKLILLHSYFE